MLPKFRISKTILIIVVSLVTGISAIGASVYFYSRYQKALRQLQNPQAAAAEELSDIVKRVGKMLWLPTDEQPILATITDASKLADQPFFALAKNGDKVLIYNTARKAILYDPIKNKILEVGPLTVASPSAAVATSSATLNFALYNGTNIKGLTNTVEQALRKNMENINIVLRDNAKKRAYEKTMVVDLTGLKKIEAQEIASGLKAEVGTLPQGEDKPVLPVGQTADFLIIAGKDFGPTGLPATSPPLSPEPTK